MNGSFVVRLFLAIILLIVYFVTIIAVAPVISDLQDAGLSYMPDGSGPMIQFMTTAVFLCILVVIMIIPFGESSPTGA